MMAELTTPIVFIVDDDVHLRQALGNLFASVGMRVELFGSTSALRARPAVEISSLCQATRSTRRENLIYRSSGITVHLSPGREGQMELTAIPPHIGVF